MECAMHFPFYFREEVGVKIGGGSFEYKGKSDRPDESDRSCFSIIWYNFLNISRALIFMWAQRSFSLLHLMYVAG